MARTVLDNAGVAHAWARGGSDARSNNGNFYFVGRTLYSYGTHFVVGIRLGVARFALTTDGYSPTTGQHKSDAWRAAHGEIIHLPALTSIADPLCRIARARNDDGKPGKADVERIKEYMRTNNVGTESGLALGAFVGLKPATVAKLDRERLARIAAKGKADAKAKRDQARKLAIRYADIMGKDWQTYLDSKLIGYSAERQIATLATDLRRSRIIAKKEGLSLKRLNAIRAKLAQVESLDVAVLSRIKTANGPVRQHIRKVRQYLADQTGWNSRGLQDVMASARYLASDLPRLSAKLLAIADHAGELYSVTVAAEREADRIAAEQRAAERAMTEAAYRAAWLSGEAGRGGRYLDDGNGGALLRIKGDTLETSWGADVPLSHAIKAFRFVKLCRDAGREWSRNGKTIRVGHYQIDAIDADGFKAGCHRINWPEIARVAALADVLDIPADDSALIPSSALVEA